MTREGGPSLLGGHGAAERRAHVQEGAQQLLRAPLLLVRVRVRVGVRVRVRVRLR